MSVSVESETLGDYKIIKLIGQGPLGQVYLAEHRFMKQPYVLKVLPEDLAADRNFLQRFQDEVGKLASLDHPGIVRVHNVSCAMGKYFLVTDCVVDSMGESCNLGHYLSSREQGLPEDELKSILSQVADALNFAHQKGVVHGNVKLNNILVSGEGAKLKVFLSDFGMTRIVGVGSVLTRSFKAVAEAYGISENGREGQKLSALHQSFLQNFAYLAPEQKRFGLGLTVDQRSDSYAFGILAYFLLTGRYPEGYFPMPSQVAPEYRMHWDGLVRTCLAMEAKDRPEKLSLELSTSTEEPQPTLAQPKLEQPTYEEDPLQMLQVDTTVKQYQPEPQLKEDVEPILTDMVVVPGGEVLRGNREGNRDEMPEHKVYLDSYAIDVHPVTNEQFMRFLKAMGGEKDHQNNSMISLKDSRIRRAAGKLDIESGYSKHPVVGITWYGAVAYARWVGKRLPTEAEWEAAARGGLERVTYPDADSMEKSTANFFSSDTTSVMSYQANGFGLFDMAGNVYEWCHDWYGYNYYDASSLEPNNPKGPIQGVYRVLRGGCWKSLKEDMRCSHRHRNNPGATNSTYGFRCAANVN